MASVEGLIGVLLKYFAPYIAVTVILFYVLYRYFTRNHNYWKVRGVPYEEPAFLAGNLLEVFKGKAQIGKHLGHLYNKYKTPYFGIYIMGKPYLVLRDPEIIKSVTIRDFNNFNDRTFACDKKADIISGSSLFVLRNPDWRNIRSKLTPIFTSGKLKLMFGIMKNCAKEMVDYLEKNHGKPIEIKEVSAKYMTDLVSACFFGFDTHNFKEESEFRRTSIKMFESTFFNSICLFAYFFVPKMVSLLKLRLLDTSFLQQVFLSTLEHREKTKTRRNDFVDLLLQLRENFKENNNSVHFDTNCMVSQAITFFIAGFETTSNVVAFALYELSLRQDCQEQLRKEIEDTMTDDDVTFETIQKMKYLDMVLAETLRRYPFGPFLNRNCKEDYVVKETGLVIEKGTPVLIPIDGIHNDPEYYPEPEKFIPERFEEGKKQQLAQNCTYLPFGMGPRNCIGDRFGLICAKIGLVYFLRQFKVEACDQTPVPLLLNPKSPFLVPREALMLTVKKIHEA